jgi:hypothetical protein
MILAGHQDPRLRKALANRSSGKDGVYLKGGNMAMAVERAHRIATAIHLNARHF